MPYPLMLGCPWQPAAMIAAKQAAALAARRAYFLMRRCTAVSVDKLKS
jgi:hypothetical protein